MDDDRGIGLNNGIPWKNKADMRRFRSVTTCNPVIMGRLTYESIGGPLGGRLNIVVTSQPEKCTGVLTASSLESALSAMRASGSMFEQVYVIGGASIYKEALDKQLVDRVELSVIPGTHGCDVFFPNIPPAYVPAFDCELVDGLSKCHLWVLEVVR